jgi:hypothetical protein
MDDDNGAKSKRPPLVLIGKLHRLRSREQAKRYPACVARCARGVGSPANGAEVQGYIQVGQIGSPHELGKDVSKWRSHMQHIAGKDKVPHTGTGEQNLAEAFS